jgi:hypothetical protein
LLFYKYDIFQFISFCGTKLAPGGLVRGQAAKYQLQKFMGPPSMEIYLHCYPLKILKTSNAQSIKYHLNKALKKLFVSLNLILIQFFPQIVAKTKSEDPFQNRVARWYIFKPIWVNFEGPFIGKC